MQTLPDYLRKGMKLVIVGCQPQRILRPRRPLYAGPRAINSGPCSMNRAWSPNHSTDPDDRRIIEFGIGLTDLVKKPTGASRNSRARICRRDRIVLSQKLEEFTPARGGL